MYMTLTQIIITMLVFIVLLLTCTISYKLFKSTDSCKLPPGDDVDSAAIKLVSADIDDLSKSLYIIDDMEDDDMDDDDDDVDDDDASAPFKSDKSTSPDIKQITIPATDYTKNGRIRNQIRTKPRSQNKLRIEATPRVGFVPRLTPSYTYTRNNPISLRNNDEYDLEYDPDVF